MQVNLRTGVLFEIERKLNFAKKTFKQEEGGYLVGRFDGSTVEVIDLSYDPKAERSAGSIRFREEHLDEVTEQLRRRDSSLYIAGTWHIHPPG